MKIGLTNLVSDEISIGAYIEQSNSTKCKWLKLDHGLSQSELCEGALRALKRRRKIEECLYESPNLFRSPVC
jgi:hypothetical protein